MPSCDSKLQIFWICEQGHRRSSKKGQNYHHVHGPLCMQICRGHWDVTIDVTSIQFPLTIQHVLNLLGSFVIGELEGGDRSSKDKTDLYTVNMKQVNVRVCTWHRSHFCIRVSRKNACKLGKRLKSFNVHVIRHCDDLGYDCNICKACVATLA